MIYEEKLIQTYINFNAIDLLDTCLTRSKHVFEIVTRFLKLFECYFEVKIHYIFHSFILYRFHYHYRFKIW